MNPYFEQTILNADSIDLVRIMYQRAISWVLEAREHLKQKKIAERSTAIMRAYAVLAELQAALRPEKAPELSQRLRSLYFYMQQRLIDSNSQQAEPPLVEVLELLMTLESAWAGAAAALAAKNAATPPLWSSAPHAEQPGGFAAQHAVSA